MYYSIMIHTIIFLTYSRGSANISDLTILWKTIVLIVHIEAKKQSFIRCLIKNYTLCLKSIKAGASLVNDVWGFKKDPYIAEVTAKYNAQ